MYEIDKMPNSIVLGYLGEKNYRTIEIDMSAWMAEMPYGIPSIVHVQPKKSEEDAYIVNTTFNDNILRWVVNAGDLGAIEGSGTAQIWLEEEENLSVVKRGKSALVATIIHDSLGEPTGTVPAPQESWLEQMTALKVATVEASSTAVEYGSAAVEAATTATGAAETATEASVAAVEASGTAVAAASDAVDAKDAAETAQAHAEQAYEDTEDALENWALTGLIINGGDATGYAPVPEPIDILHWHEGVPPELTVSAVDGTLTLTFDPGEHAHMDEEDDE